ncbi:putative baseplate assembly protein [Sedimenticola selenatireducens]|uniref:Putative baseplate assembly protein n=1 Tax=Sedimenticola selenatireducens TaxID=191960 RepID=A0A2N6CT28_9GAMM|nr:putative baseplate assembly protein [Sedimenticola selenatireducens]PLX60272.1 MAG: putative baseplate assembly protein [Sedimenticola selenatireducens]
MSQPWWGREVGARNREERANPVPSLLDSDRLAIRQEIQARLPAFTPDWTNARDGDAGYALLKLYAELAEPVGQRLNRLPDKALIEFLRTLGVDDQGARPARAMLAFTASNSAPRSVLVPVGFQTSAAAADSSDTTVIFETERTLYVAPGALESAFAQEGSGFYELPLAEASDSEPMLPFGKKPRLGSALLLGLDSRVVPGPSISIGIRLATEQGAPPPVSIGGIEAVQGLLQPLLRWELFDGGSFKALEVIRDETRNLAQSGVVELRIPNQWRVGTPSGISTQRDLRWLRLRLLHGQFSKPPALSLVRINMVPTIAARTIRNEVLTYIPGGGGRRMALSQTPVRAGSLVLTVDEGELQATARSFTAMPGTTQHVWRAVNDLSAYGPDDPVYVLDNSPGEVLFGDGSNGAALPSGFRHVVATRYQVASGKEGSVEAEKIDTLVSSVPFLESVINPSAASGGRDGDSIGQAIAKGPQQIRARGRAVTTADYALLALQADGADVYRAHAVSGVHAGLDGARMPGVVSVYLLGPEPGDGNPPYPDPDRLESVARFLSEEVAPAGTEVVAAAPYFHRVGVRATLVVQRAADGGEIVRQTLRALDEYFHPLRGGEAGDGWPFAGVISHDALLRRLLAVVPELSAISLLNLVVDGFNLPACTDFTPDANALLWPTTHELRLVEEGAS